MSVKRNVLQSSQRVAHRKRQHMTIKWWHWVMAPRESLFLVKRPQHHELACLVGTRKPGEVGYALNKARPL